MNGSIDQGSSSEKGEGKDKRLSREGLSTKPTVRGPFAGLGRAIVGARWFLIPLVLVAFALAGAFGASKVSTVLKGGGFEVKGSESDRASQIIQDDFNQNFINTAFAVYESSTLNIDDPPFLSAMNASLDRAEKLPEVESVRRYGHNASRLGSNDKTTAYAVVNIKGASDTEVQKNVPAVREALASDQLRVRLAGDPAMNYDMEKTINEDLLSAELLTFPVVLLLLFFVFRTWVASIVPVLLGAFTVTGAMALLYVAGLYTDQSVYAQSVASMIGLGLGIDFSLLIVSRFREELGGGLSPKEAAIVTAATAGRSVVFSGLTVIASMSVLLFIDLMPIRSMALAVMLAAAVAMVGALALVPALLAVLGRSVNFRIWRAVARKGQANTQSHAPSGFWYRWSNLVMKRPWTALFVGFLLAGSLTYPALTLNMRAPGPDVLPATIESRQADETLKQAFGLGEFAPVSILVGTPNADGVWSPAFKEELWLTTQRLKQDPRVVRVDSLANLGDLSLDEFKALPKEAFQTGPVAEASKNFVGNEGRTAQILLTSANESQSTQTRQLVSDLRGGLSELRTYGEVLVGGYPAGLIDFKDKLYSQFGPLALGVMGVGYVILLLFFGSIWLPLKAVLMNVLSILAAVGGVTLVFQYGFGEDLLGFTSLGGVGTLTPIIMFAILFGLSTDYEVFLLSRVKERYMQTHDNVESVAYGLARSASVISAAAAIMVAVFFAFALTRVLVIKELGVGFVIAIILDATLIRLLVVPAAMRLMGRYNWWMPKPLARMLPRLSEA